MTALIIIAAIVLILAFFLNMKIRAEIKYLGGEFDFKVKYLCFTFFPLKEKKEKKQKIKKEKSKRKRSSDDEAEAESEAESAEETSEQCENGKVTEQNEEQEAEPEKKKAEKKKLSEKIDKLKDIIEKVRIIWSCSKKWLKHIFKHIYFENLTVDFIIADEDAYTAAMNYGKVNAAFYNGLNVVRTLFPVSVRTVDIVCDFERKEPVYDFELKITLRPATVFSAVFGILFGLLLNLKKLIGKSNKQPENNKAVSM